MATSELFSADDYAPEDTGQPEPNRGKCQGCSAKVTGVTLCDDCRCAKCRRAKMLCECRYQPTKQTRTTPSLAGSMVLDAQFKLIQDHFEITDPEMYRLYTPSEVLAIPNVGEASLNHLRLHLANLGITLAGDQTPEHWQAELTAVRGATAIAPNQKAVTAPFTILIDTAEQQPFGFKGFKGDGRHRDKPLIVPTKQKHLGPTHGDYSIEGYETRFHVERKSEADVISTVLSFGERREQFERTLAFLSEIECGFVVVECDRFEAVKSIGDHTHPCNRNAKNPPPIRQRTWWNQVLAWESDYRVPWVFAGHRRYAEMSTLTIFQRAFRHEIAQQKQIHKKGA